MGRNGKQKEDCVHAGCSAVSWETEDGKHLFGRNLDFNRLSGGTSVVYIPAGTEYYSCTDEEGKGISKWKSTTAYRAIGIGLSLSEGCPVLYEGMNEKGLMGAQLYYREFAEFPERGDTNCREVQPPLLVTDVLATCTNVRETARRIREQITLVGRPMLGTIAPLHWIFSDKEGNSIVVESRREGVFVFENAMGILTNSPGYDWHCTNLLNYMHIQDRDRESRVLNGHEMRSCFSGTGALGLPGDFSSPSRFVRLAFLKEYMKKGKNETDGVVNLFHMMGHVSFPAGFVKVGNIGEIAEGEEQIVDYDYTVYTSVMCAESLNFYWTTYENPKIRCINMKELWEISAVRLFPFRTDVEFQKTC